MADSSMQEGLLAIYRDLDADVAAAGPVCDLSGRCCRFKEYGHVLFISRPEAESLLAVAYPASAVVDDAGCPYQVNGLCTARERRPLGCRVYYCDARYAGTGEALSERYVKRLKQLHEENGVPWEYRPLARFLEERRSCGTPPVADLNVRIA